MKRIGSALLILSLIMVCASACTARPESSLIKSQRRFDKYIQPQTDKPNGMIDLSEGPKLKYDASFGPKNLNFDFKIENPY